MNFRGGSSSLGVISEGALDGNDGLFQLHRHFVEISCSFSLTRTLHVYYVTLIPCFQLFLLSIINVYSNINIDQDGDEEDPAKEALYALEEGIKASKKANAKYDSEVSILCLFELQYPAMSLRG